MNIIVGATGQVGSNLIREIIRSGHPVRAVVRNPAKVPDQTIEIRTADLFNADQLTKAFKDGTTVFLLTPEIQSSNDIIGDTRQIIDNYRNAIKYSGIKRIVGLSSIGAHVNDNTGNILMSRLLEQGFDDLEAEKVFIRPSYYFSNWLGYRESVEQYGVLPTFFPENLEIDMNSPVDLAEFIAKVMTDKSITGTKTVFELAGQQKYSSADVAKTFSQLLNKEVTAQSIPREQWKEMLKAVGFTDNTASNLSDMTQAVIDNKLVPERPGHIVTLPTTLEDYMEKRLTN